AVVQDVDRPLVDDGRPHDDADREGEEHRDQRHQVEPEVDHDPAGSLGRYLAETAPVCARVPGLTAHLLRSQNQLCTVVQKSENTSRNAWRKTRNDGEAIAIA